MQGCAACGLSRHRKNVVIYRGARRPRLLFLGEAPGAQEDESGFPFVGKAGQLLDRAIAELGLPADGYGITNVVMCHPPGNVFDPKAAVACRPWLELKLALLAPEVIVTLGGRALRALEPTSGRPLAEAGRPRSWRGRPLYPMLHPAATFRRRAFRDQWYRDLKRLRSMVDQWIPGFLSCSPILPRGSAPIGSPPSSVAFK